jgi:hypothetical protein
MLISTFNGEKSIAELANRIYSGASSDPALQKQAIDALLSANPQLANLAVLRQGSRIVVPQAPLAVNPAQVVARAPVGLPGRNTVVMGQQLDNLKTKVPAAATAAVTNSNGQLALVQNRQVQAASSKDAALAQQLAAVAQQANAKIQAAQALQAEFLKELAPLQAILTRTTAKT